MMTVVTIYGISILFLLLFCREDLAEVEQSIKKHSLTPVQSIIAYTAAFVFLPPFALINCYYFVKVFVIWLMSIGSSND